MERSATRRRRFSSGNWNALMAFGIDTILVVPASVGVDFIPGSEQVPYELALRTLANWSKARCRWRKNFASQSPWKMSGINLLSPMEMRTFIDSFHHEQVGAYFDVGNVLATGYPEDWITLLGERIRRVHFKDYRRGVGSVDGFCDLLSGDVHWPAVMKAFHDISYKGWVAAEMIPPAPFYKHCPEILIRNTGRAMDAILQLGA